MLVHQFFESKHGDTLAVIPAHAGIGNPVSFKGTGSHRYGDDEIQRCIHKS